jgi:hypothetical protein
MKLLKKVEDILNKYNLSVNVPDEYNTVYHYLTLHPNEEDDDFCHPEINDSFLINKYKDNIPMGWYGFAIGNPTPKNWYIVIDKILELLIKNDPSFEIHQIKLKFGGIRFYVSSDEIEDINEIEDLIDEKLFNEKLIY